MKKTDFLNNPQSKKVVTHVPILRLVIVSPLHWPFVHIGIHVFNKFNNDDLFVQECNKVN